MGACRLGHLSIVNTLLAAGADVTIQTNSGVSALNKAVCNGHIDVIGALFRHGADVNACDDDGCTPLHVAAQEDQAGAIDALMQAGANIECSSEGGSLAPLFFAINHCSLKSHAYSHPAARRVLYGAGHGRKHAVASGVLLLRRIPPKKLLPAALRRSSGGPYAAGALPEDPPGGALCGGRPPGGPLRGAGCRNTPSASCCGKLRLPHFRPAA
ncbi:Chain A, Crystal Structure Of A Designed Full Consensus Ankyrin [Ectocarpus siliculosus]|uniref:Chain A, Crystal Structure Of A Designed Full Consensus Ankyrin n=1 Tax=Ectocarpus siliculosus TaxID=2880 RepID=D8LRR9_ECTSI|nr:Chain A, Crystal Structure Of A Designed Full Consensus Ankyrin [Ectocarpus siliculosus]|eukprot:CBN73836.1 Chain A, Crystal Structure Of A Designed Full Consensus Ankyrin [Ectocarpus siliculosus]